MDHLPLIDFEDLAGSAKPSPRRRPLVGGLVRAARRAWLRYRINSTQRYLDQCVRDGIVIGHMVDEWRWEIHDMREQLRALEVQ